MTGRIPPMIHGRGRKDGSYANRFPRYAANAERSAQFAEQAVGRWEYTAELNKHAAGNAKDNDDEVAAELYQEMADCALDAADAFRDLVTAARAVREHYEKLTEEINGDTS